MQCVVDLIDKSNELTLSLMRLWDVLLFSIFLNPPRTSSRTRICHFHPSLCCMIYYFYINPPAQTSAEFFIKAFHMVCDWVTSCTLCGKFTHSHDVPFFLVVAVE